MKALLLRMAVAALQWLVRKSACKAQAENARLRAALLSIRDMADDHEWMGYPLVDGKNYPGIRTIAERALEGR